MFEVGAKVEFIKEVAFDYQDGTKNVVAEVGDIKEIENIDKDGYCFDNNNFYIEIGYEHKYFKKVD